MKTSSNLPEKILTFLMFLIFIITIACTFTSCKSKQKIVEKESIVQKDTVEVFIYINDTVIKEIIKTITLPANSDNVIENPCDEKGNIRPINQTIKSGNASISVYSKDGKLYISQKIDSVSSTFDREYRSRFEKDSIRIKQQFERDFSKVDKKVVFVWPWWLYALILYGILSTALNLYQRFKLF